MEDYILQYRATSEDKWHDQPNMLWQEAQDALRAAKGLNACFRGEYEYRVVRRVNGKITEPVLC